MTATLKKLWKNEYFQTVAIVGLILLVILGFWYGSQIALNTQYPALAVVSGSMCIPQGGQCDGWTHPFARTLHIGDMIIVQGVKPTDLSADNYPNSDIIVFRRPDRPSELIVHRIVAKVSENGTIYFWTKGDGNGIKWPTPPSTVDYDSWGKVSQDEVIGKVVMRIPWLGHVALSLRTPLGMLLVIALIIILIIAEFIVPLLRRKKPAAEPEQQKETQQQP